MGSHVGQIKLGLDFSIGLVGWPLGLDALSHKPVATRHLTATVATGGSTTLKPTNKVFIVLSNAVKRMLQGTMSSQHGSVYPKRFQQTYFD